MHLFRFLTRFVLPFLPLASLALAAAPKPNFLLIVADDLCWRDLGFTGNPDVRTPHLDRLRTEGMQLHGMFTPATTCSPSRHALYTGLHCVRAGAYPNHTRAYEGTRSIFTHLNTLGYRTGLQGKEHIAPKASFPYEHLGGKNADDFAATKSFLTRDAAQPWLLVFASNDPHSPWNRGPAGLHDPAKLTVPPYLHDNATTRRLLADYYGEVHKLDWQVGQLLALLAETKQADNTLVIFLSEQGGSMPYAGKWSVYDNGIRVAALARWPGKIAPSSSSRALLQYTDIPATFLAAAGADPTKIDTGCPDTRGHRGFDGRSFLDVLTGKTDRLHEVVFAQHTTVGINGYKAPYPIRAARDARYKYIRNLAPQNTYDIGGIHQTEPLTSWKADAKNNPALAARIDWLYHRPAEELYDLQADDLETKNLAADPAHAATKARLSAALDAWMAQQGDQGMATEMKALERQGPSDNETRAAKQSKKKAKQ
ncbi:MAG: sulfatase [Opitutaceae bacterium]|nr:sulfatase [Opitutaceae bacterium]